MELLDNLKKKQDEEFKIIENKYYSKTVQPENYLSSEQVQDIKNFINQVRSETAEAVAREERDRIWAYMEDWMDNLSISEDRKREISNIIFDLPFNSLKE